MGSGFNISKCVGLTQVEASQRLQQDGPNELPSAKKRSLFAIALDVIREPMFLLLVACGALYLLLGDMEEALMLLGFVFVVMGITLYQERKTERALEALRDLSSPRALVIRDARQQRIAGSAVVRGDICIIREGDRVPADALVLSATNLSLDESLLSGESVAVRKLAWDKVEAFAGEMGRPGGDDLPFVFSGTLVVQGQGVVEVRAIGANTQIGRIGKALQTLQPESTLLQKETGTLVKKLAIFGIVLCAIVSVVYALTRDDWIGGLLAGITLAMATLPEEFPVVLTIFLALGAWRISRKQVLTRRMPAVETLGSATVLCTDKTGTLTQNRMSLAKLYVNGEYLDVLEDESSEAAKFQLPETFHRLVEYGILAGQRDPFDPMEKAVQRLAAQQSTMQEHLHNDWKHVQEYPLQKGLLAISHVWQSLSADRFVIAAKGAPEAIFDLCHFSQSEREQMMLRVAQMADAGLRVLGVASADFVSGQLPEKQHDFSFGFIGLLGFADPVRATVPDALKDCQAAGVRVIMITGDYPGTAQKIAREIGLVPNDQFITGSELDAMADAELQRRIACISIFARAVPEQKLRIVKALKANGEIVAMTGDGVNDASALKAAHIGVAMGGRGTDVARESSDLVLLDDDFSSIVEAIKLGRRIFDNIKKAIAYIFAIHVPIAGMSLLPVLFGWPLALLPVHILFLELIIDPACSTIFEAEKEEPGVMKRPPRKANEPLFSKTTLVFSILQGLAVLLVVFGLYAYATLWGLGGYEARALCFTALIVANVSLILTNRSWKLSFWQLLSIPNRPQWWIVGAAIVFLGLVLNIPFLQNVFRFDALSGMQILLSVGLGILSVAWFEIWKKSKG